MSHGFCSKFRTLSTSAKFWKSVKTWQSYKEFKGENFFETVYIVSLRLQKEDTAMAVIEYGCNAQCILFVRY